MKRQFILKLQDRTALFLSWLRAIVIAIVLSTLYVNLPETTGSAFGKGGLMFISLLFNCFSSFSELPGESRRGTNPPEEERQLLIQIQASCWDEAS